MRGQAQTRQPLWVVIRKKPSGAACSRPVTASASGLESGKAGGFAHAPHVGGDRLQARYPELAREIVPGHRCELGAQQGLALIQANPLRAKRRRLPAEAGQGRRDDVT